MKTADTAALVTRARLLLAAARETLGEGKDTAHVRHARLLIALARGVWSRVRHAVALANCKLRATYQRTSTGWRAVVTADDEPIWRGLRIYRHRQSASRAAWKYADRFARNCEASV